MQRSIVDAWCKVEFWVNSGTHAPPGVSTTQQLVSGCNDCVITIENLVDPQYVRSKSPLETDNLLENTDGALDGVLMPNQCSLEVTACYLP